VLSVTTKVAVAVPVLPSATTASATAMVGVASSSVIVPVACASPTVAFVGPERSTTKVSLTSSRTSPFTCTVTGRTVWPGLNVTVAGASSA
jgi:hypothetical protein